MMNLSREGREFFYFPFWGDTLTTVQIDIGDGVWVNMQATPDYVPAEPVAADAQWFRILIAGPDVTANPTGTVVLAATGVVRFKVSDNPEILVRVNGLLRLI